MIDSVSMKKIAVYQQETVLKGCKRINLIYGNNGTGKTLLSNYLANPDDPSFRDCSIHWDNDAPLSVFVFNRKFCDDNFSETEIPGIFTIGRENAETEEKADTLRMNILSQKESLAGLREEYQSLSKEKQTLQNKCIDSLWDRVRVYKQLLGEYFVKPVSKAQCFSKVENAMQQGLEHAVCNIPDLKYRAEVLNRQNDVQYPIYPFFDNSDLAEIETDPIWEETVAESAGASSESDSGQKENWIRQGAQYVGDDHICPFCEQEIHTEKVLNRITRLRTDQPEPGTDRCDELSSRYESLIQRFLSAAERILKENRDDGSAFLDVNRFSDTLTNLRNLFHANLLFMQRKRISLASSVKPQSSSRLTEALNTMIDDSNSSSFQANSMLKNFGKSKSELKKDAWDSFCKASEADLNEYQDATRELDREIGKITEKGRSLQAAVQQMESDLEKVLQRSVNIRESVERINEELESLGISNFRLKLTADQNRYVILREDGTPAGETLSDGEKTLIMLLYFLRLIEGSADRGKIRSERVIVIDDPVSNLDDTALNAVLDRIGKLIVKILDGDKSVLQLFVLSHRKECTKKLRTSDPRLENGQNIKLWILRKKDGSTRAQEFAFS